MADKPLRTSYKYKTKSHGHWNGAQVDKNGHLIADADLPGPVKIIHKNKEKDK
jgi:hypothetical protein